MASEDVAVTTLKKSTELARSNSKSTQENTVSIPEGTSASEILRLLGAPSNEEIRKPRTNFEAVSVNPSTESSTETSVANPNLITDEDSTVQAMDDNHGNSSSTSEERPEDFMGSVEFWDVWRRRKKKACEEVGICTCFEGIGSMF